MTHICSLLSLLIQKYGIMTEFWKINNSYTFIQCYWQQSLEKTLSTYTHVSWCLLCYFWSDWNIVCFQAKAPFDINKLYSTEILAILLQNSDGKWRDQFLEEIYIIFSYMYVHAVHTLHVVWSFTELFALSGFAYFPRSACFRRCTESRWRFFIRIFEELGQWGRGNIQMVIVCT